MPRSPDYALRAAVHRVLHESGTAMSFRRIRALTGGSDWNLRMALNYLIDSGVVLQRGRNGVTCEYWLSGREFESSQPRGFDASGLMQVWQHGQRQ